ncbi:MAG: bifunctional riboflavin kinase/FMN adenylyltransferase [Bifidobacterium sp.]|jgi:riboflavin kinase/FMN adenylyltransferase|nr:bifunctional riboflavin kinase/FMN adenylyltransferase [Bifidobacterium sp.]
MNITTLTPDNGGLVQWPTLSTERRSVVTVGVFDGMHRGHRQVVERTVALAGQSHSFSVVIMFDPRPSYVHAYADGHDGMQPPRDARDTQRLTSVDQRIRVLRDLGVDQVLVVHYTLEFAAKSYRFFLGQLVGKLGMRTLVLGSDAVMGADRAGDVKAISNLALATGVFELVVVDDCGPGYVRIPRNPQPVVPKGPGEPTDPTSGMSKTELRAWSKNHDCRKTRVWSSSNVRYLLMQGRIGEANAILGDRHAVEGLVTHGEQRGRTIGFPTANLGSDIDGYVPVDGVYAGWMVDLGAAAPEGAPHQADARARMDKESPWRWPAAISIGTKPTYSRETGLSERVVESYAVTKDWLDLYGHRVRIEFCACVSPQITFAGTEELKAALGRYAEETVTITNREH